MKIYRIIKNNWGFFTILLITFLYFFVLPVWYYNYKIKMEYRMWMSYTQIHIAESQNESESDTEAPEDWTIGVEDDETVECCEMLQPSNIDDIDKFKNNLRGLAPYAEIFIQAEVQTGVNARFLAAIAALESGWGKSDLAKYKDNLFGWTCEYGYESFGTKQECILMVAQDIKDKYLTEGGAYFEGWTVEDVAKHYNTVNPAWADTVREIMIMLGE